MNPASSEQVARSIRTHFVYPPIPDRNYDWMACFNDFDLGSLVGYGATQEAAIADLKQQAEEA